MHGGAQAVLQLANQPGRAASKRRWLSNRVQHSGVQIKNSGRYLFIVKLNSGHQPMRLIKVEKTLLASHRNVQAAALAQHIFVQQLAHQL